MSLGGGKAQSLDDAVNAAVEAGLHFAVAAGKWVLPLLFLSIVLINSDNQDACKYSPASAELAVTVGASTLGDERAYFSNHGKCVDIFAPGLNILSTWNGGNETSNTISGTSMASPHICGLLAYLLSIEGSETFSILTGESADEAEVETVVTLYGKALSLLPKLAQSVLPAATSDENVRPTPKKGEVTPAKLKKALIALSSAGKITEGKAGTSLPAGTPNLLAFNNATLPAKGK
jgi:cerevisin